MQKQEQGGGMSIYATISDKNLISDSDDDFELARQLKELTTDEYKTLFKGGRAMIVKVIYIDDR